MNVGVFFQTPIFAPNDFRPQRMSNTQNFFNCLLDGLHTKIKASGDFYTLRDKKMIKEIILVWKDEVIKKHAVSSSISNAVRSHFRTYGKELTISSLENNAFFLLFWKTYADEEW